MTIQPQDETYADYMGTARPDPVDVIVRASTPIPIEDRPTRAWNPGQVTVPADRVVQLAPANPARVPLKLKAISTNTGAVWIGSDPSNTTATNGYPMDPGEKVELTTRHAVYALAATAGNVVAVIAQHLDG